MNKDTRAYEPPRMKVYRFDESDRILTSSSGVNPPPAPEANYAANALNIFMDGTNTTIEK